MQSFESLAKQFGDHFQKDHFPATPASLYDPNRYFLSLGGKRVRPVMCLMANELFDTIGESAWMTATAIELFHNFTLIHDDIMDKAPLRRGHQTLHTRYGESTALLAGDVMLIAAYDYLNSIPQQQASKIISLFNLTARQVCEGQQLDMNFEQQNDIDFDSYLNMINLKTSVLLAASLKMGAIIGGALDRNQGLLYEFGRKLGLAFQVQDDYLDAFGDPEKFGKKRGGDIEANKKTFLLIHALNNSTQVQRVKLNELMNTSHSDKVDEILQLFEQCGARQWALELKEKFVTEALQHLDDVAVLSSRKQPLTDLTAYLIHREN